MPKFVGQSLKRLEDQRFVTGEGRYMDDLNAPDQVHAAIVRSPHAHAEIEGVDVSSAKSAPGVLAVYTAADLAEAGLRPIPSMTRTPPFQYFNGDGSEMADGSQPVLATDRVRYVGEPVAAVVAETVEAARDAAELVNVSYRPLNAVADIDSTRAPDAPRLWPELDDNRSCFWDEGDEVKVRAALADAHHVIDVEVEFPKTIVAYMEPKGGLARYNKDEGSFVIEAGCQSAHRLRETLAEILNVEAEKVRSIVPDMGGGFGARNTVCPEFAVILFAARDLGRPVKWVIERADSFLSDGHARGHRLSATLGLDEEGRFTGIAVRSLWGHGAYFSSRSIFILAIGMGRMVCGPYRIPVHHFSLEGWFTNTAPTVSYRGISRAEPGYVLERLVEEAARQTGMDPVELRRKNLIEPHEMPWESPTGYIYGKAEMPKVLDMALEAADWSGFETRRTEAAGRGRLRGRGLACYIMSAGGVPYEHAEVRIGGNGAVTVLAGTQDFGMSHETTFAQAVADELGVEPDAVSLIQGDTDQIPEGVGGQGSRCMRIGGGVIVQAARLAVEQGRAIAEELLEASASDIAFEHGYYAVAGTDRKVALAEVAQTAESRGTPLAVRDVFTTEAPAFPNGCHLCEIEVDPETGQYTIDKFVSVVDPGTIVNPMIVEGQMHGGVAQGIGEAALERVVYDTEGQLLSGSMMDYALPRADDLPFFTTLYNPVPGEDNPLGVKGVGEAGTMVAPAAVIHAMLDALKDRGVTHVEMPLTPESVWRTLNGGE